MESVIGNCSLAIPMLFDWFGGIREHTGGAEPVVFEWWDFLPGQEIKSVIMTMGLLYHNSCWIFLALFKSTNLQSFNGFTSQTCLVF